VQVLAQVVVGAGGPTNAFRMVSTGTINTGGGGGGGRNNAAAQPGAAGGSGIVIVRYAV
jgi:hypothetical protein